MTSYQVVPTIQPISVVSPQRTPSKTDVGEEIQKLNPTGAREELCLSPLPIEIKVYRRRWLMLVIFILVSMSSAFQWIQFSIINNLIMKYWHIFKGIRSIARKILKFFFLLQVLQRWLNNRWLDFSRIHGYLRALHFHFHSIYWHRLPSSQHLFPNLFCCLDSAYFPWGLDYGQSGT
jgi:hypothetical protein